MNPCPRCPVCARFELLRPCFHRYEKLWKTDETYRPERPTVSAGLVVSPRPFGLQPPSQE